MQVRLKAEGSDGKYVYKQMIMFFWDDVDHRMKSLGVRVHCATCVHPHAASWKGKRVAVGGVARLPVYVRRET